MGEHINSDSFDEIVQWAYETLPQEIRRLPDFPGIQVVDEPTEYLLKSRNLPKGYELLGLYSGVFRTERSHFQTRMAPDLIFVFRGPILRCSRGNLRAEVKDTVWHEVAHWLGLDEERARAVGHAAREQLENETSKTGAGTNVAVPQRQATEIGDEQDATSEEQIRCINCYSADVTVRETDRPVRSFGSLLMQSGLVHVRTYHCNGCGHEWDD